MATKYTHEMFLSAVTELYLRSAQQELSGSKVPTLLRARAHSIDEVAEEMGCSTGTAGKLARQICDSEHGTIVCMRLVYRQAMSSRTLLYSPSQMQLAAVLIAERAELERVREAQRATAQARHRLATQVGLMAQCSMVNRLNEGEVQS